jgi:N-acetylmuramoyl-L-alanine amidase
VRWSVVLISGVLFAGAASSCRSVGAPPGRAEPAETALEPGDPLVEARARVAALRAGRVEPGVDDLVQRLSLIGPEDPARRKSAMLLAGALLLERAERAHDARDRSRARDYLIAASPSGGESPPCEDALSLAALLERVGERGRAQAVLGPVRSRCGAEPSPPSAPRGRVAEARHRRVVIDAGHGGTDPGAIGPTGLKESEVTLDVARRLADRLAVRYGFQVALTRDSDVFVPLEQRASHANGTTADLFVSIHCNAANNREARGISTFALEDSPRVAARLTAREGELVDGDVGGSWDVSRILADLSLSRHGRDSVGFASAIQRALLQDVRLLYPQVEDMGVHPARFHVLVTTRMPAVLVELSFISNLTEEQRLRSDGYRDVLAGSIARAIDEHVPGGV